MNNAFNEHETANNNTDISWLIGMSKKLPIIRNNNLKFIRTIEDMPHTPLYYEILNASISYEEIAEIFNKNLFDEEFIKYAELVVYNFLTGTQQMVINKENDMIHALQLSCHRRLLGCDNLGLLNQVSSETINSSSRLKTYGGEYQRWAFKYYFAMLSAWNTQIKTIGGSPWNHQITIFQELKTCDLLTLLVVKEELSFIKDSLLPEYKDVLKGHFNYITSQYHYEIINSDWQMDEAKLEALKYRKKLISSFLTD